jgi:fructose-1-phosphate kinase PfkB-like protein
MIAGLTAGCLAELPLSEIFVKGVACATASVMTEGTQLIDKPTYKSLLPQVEIKSI